MGIHNTHMYEKAVVAMAKQSVTLEVLSYHASASMEDAQRLRVRTVFLSLHISSFHPHFQQTMKGDKRKTPCEKQKHQMSIQLCFHFSAFENSISCILSIA